MNNRLVQILIILIVILIAGFFLGIPYQDNSEIDETITLIKNHKHKNDVSANFNSEEFKKLPTSVKKYLRKGIKKNDRHPVVAQLTLIGKIRKSPKESWLEINSEKTYSLITPEFIEVYETSEFLSLWERTIKEYINGVASSKTKLISSITTEELFGNQLNRSYLAFYLIESVFAPTVLLPSMDVKWSKIDNSTAKATVWYKNIRSNATFYFNKQNEVTMVTTNDIFMPDDIDYKRVPLTLHLANYKDVGDYYIPTFFETEWNFVGENFAFGRFQITEILYE